MFLEKLNNLVEEWGSSYSGRFLSYLMSQNKSFLFIQIYNINPKDPIAFKKANDKFISKKNKTIGERPVGFGTYDFGSPDVATNWFVIGAY